MPSSWESAHFESLRRTHCLGSAVVAFDSLDSTQDEAKRRIGGGLPSRTLHGTVIVADGQTKGHGRLDRVWESLPGNLAATLMLETALPLDRLAPLPLVVGLSLASALAPHLDRPKRLSLKWPNDVLIDGAKCGGILCESLASPPPSGEETRWVLVGIGVNLSASPNPQSVSLRMPATHLAAAGLHLGREAVLAEFLNDFEPQFKRFSAEGFSPFKAEYGAWAYTPFSRIDIDGKILEGRSMGINGAGALLFEDREKNLHTLTYGEALL